MRARQEYHMGDGGRSLKLSILHSNAAVGTQILLTADHDSILFDVGDGTLRDLVDRTFRFDTLRAIFLTHEHFDHISGLYSLVNFLTLLGRKEILRIMTPRPCSRIRAFLGPPLMYYSPQFLISILELSGGEEIQIGSCRVRTFEVSHAATNSLGYSILDACGHKIVIGGDTRICPSLEREVAGADIAVLESTYNDEGSTDAHESGHMTKGEARAIGRKARRAVLVHTLPKKYFDEINRSCRNA